jgi:hypothetical protein
MLLSVSKEIAARETLDDILTYLMHMTAKELNAERCRIFLNDSETDELYAHYREGIWNKAISSFTRASELNPHDCLSQMFIKRCSHMLENPSDKTWDGIWVMTSK